MNLARSTKVPLSKRARQSVFLLALVSILFQYVAGSHVLQASADGRTHARRLQQLCNNPDTFLVRVPGLPQPGDGFVNALTPHQVVMRSDPLPSGAILTFAFQLVVVTTTTEPLAYAVKSNFTFRGKGDVLTINYRVGPPDSGVNSSITLSEGTTTASVSTPLTLPFSNSPNPMVITFREAVSRGSALQAPQPLRFTPIAGCSTLNVLPYPTAFDPARRATAIQRLSADPLPPLPAQNFIVDESNGKLAAALRVGHDQAAGLTCLVIDLPDDLDIPSSSILLSIKSARPGNQLPFIKIFPTGTNPIQICLDPYSEGILPAGAPAAAITMLMSVTLSSQKGKVELTSIFSPFVETPAGAIRPRLQFEPSVPVLVAGQEVPLQRVGGGPPVGSAVLLYDTDISAACVFFTPNTATGIQFMSNPAVDSFRLKRTVRSAAAASKPGVTQRVCFRPQGILAKPALDTGSSVPLQLTGDGDTAGPASGQAAVDVLRFTTQTEGGSVGVTTFMAVTFAQCAPGTGGRVCSLCPANTFSPGGTTSNPWPVCKPCPTGLSSAPGSTACRDTQPPRITIIGLPSTRQFLVSSTLPSVRFFWTAIAFDNVAPAFLPAICTPPPGNLFFTARDTPVTCTARDAAGNVAAVSFIIRGNRLSG